MADHRFSEFHCNKLPLTEKDVIAIAIEPNADRSATQHVAMTKDGTLSSPVKERVIMRADGGVDNAGPVKPDDAATGEKLVQVCRTALSMEP
jgi:hypothetical protein